MANRWSALRVGDRIKIEARVSSISPSGAVNFEITQDADFEIIELAKWPGQVAYEAYQRQVGNVSKSWDRLDHADREVWNRIADSVIDSQRA